VLTSHAQGGWKPSKSSAFGFFADMLDRTAMLKQEVSYEYPLGHFDRVF
jgi:hypothetical protein